MLCALTLRKLKPGSFDDFIKAFVPPEGVDAPAGWKQFYALQNAEDENEVITFGLFDGTMEELRAGQSDSDEFDKRREAAEQFVESKGADGIYNVVEQRKMD
jgi:heme-degrading monooxygenase HmoA